MSSYVSVFIYLKINVSWTRPEHPKLGKYSKVQSESNFLTPPPPPARTKN